MGSIRKEGLVFTVSFSIRRTISLRVRNFNSNQLKVNDVKGNPIEIAAVIVYKVVDSAKAVFDVDDYSKFVNIQSEAAIRAVATRYTYDSFKDEEERTLRGNADEISDQLSREVEERLQVAGVEVIEARLTHLAYSTEIAQAMLQRQQATAILAARRHIVNGAVGIVEDRSEEHTSELQSRGHLVCRLLLEKKKNKKPRGRTGERQAERGREPPKLAKSKGPSGRRVHTATRA